MNTIYRLMNHDNTDQKPQFEKFDLDELNAKFNTSYTSVEDATFADPEYLFSTEEMLHHNKDKSELSAKIEQLRTEVIEANEKWKNTIDEITNQLDYKNGSIFSYNRDRLMMFVDGIEETSEMVLNNPKN